MTGMDFFSNGREIQDDGILYFNRLIKKGNELYNDNKLKEAENIFRQSLSIAEKQGIDSLFEISHFSLLRTNFKLKEYVKVIANANDFEYYAGEKMNVRQAETKEILSKVYQETYQWEKARHYMGKSLRIRETLGNVVKKREANYQYCNTIFYSSNYEDALLCYENFAEEVEFARDTYHIIKSTIAIGATLGRIKDFDRSIPKLREASVLLTSVDNTKEYLRLKGFVHHNLGNDYFGIGKYEESLREIEKGIYYREIEKSSLLGFTYSLAGKIHAVMGDEPKMNLYLSKALVCADEFDNDLVYRQVYAIRRDNALRKKDYPTAYAEMEKITNLDQKRYKENVEGLMAKEVAKGVVNKKELEINNLRIEKERKEQQQLNLALILSLISLFLIGSLYFIHRLRKVNQELATKNKLIEKQKEELEISNKDLEQFAYIASHDLKEPVRTIGSYASLLNRRYKDKLGDSGSEFVNFIKQASTRMNLLLSDLLHYSRLNTSQFEKKEVDMNDVLLIVEENLYKVFHSDNVRVEVSELPTIHANKIQMIRIFQNLIKNGVVYNQSEEKIIKVWAEEGKEFLTFFVKDNGIGIAQEYQDKVFEIFKRLHSKDEYDGSGIGLSSCQKIVMMHGGRINLKSEVGKGTTFYFTIPKE